MATVAFICPKTRLKVHACVAVPDHVGGEDELYTTIKCIACGGVHLIDLRTGKILWIPQDQERQ